MEGDWREMTRLGQEAAAPRRSPTARDGAKRSPEAPNGFRRAAGAGVHLANVDELIERDLLEAQPAEQLPPAGARVEDEGADTDL